jgi:ABC-type antimicrobial peptide transport system permease subunit
MIVGVVEDILTFRLVGEERAMLYLPPSHPAFGNKPAAALLVRVGDGDAGALIPVIRREVQALAPNMPFVQVAPYEDLVAPQLRPWKLGATMFGIYGIIALVIAAVGLYSVLAYWVSQRTHEIGVRMALGAQRLDVLRMVALQSTRAIGLGIVIGAALAAFGARWVADILYETSPHDIGVYGIAALVLAVASLIAAVVPTHRSTRIDPAAAIRTE